jgi:hypothetical protein
MAAASLPHRQAGFARSDERQWICPLGLHVLVADDERTTRMIFGRFLERLGYKCGRGRGHG